MKRLLMAGIAGMALAAFTTASASADTLQDVIDDGKLTVGVKADYAPWGMRDANGNLVGLEIDLMKDLAKRIGLELVAVVASNRMEFLEQGKIDVMMATMSDTPQRREVVGIVQPNYYSSGVAILAHKDSGIDSWESIEGKKICGIQGAWYNKDHGLKNGAEMVVFKGVPEVEAAVLDQRCVGWLYDDSAFIPRKVNEPEKWADYSIATPVVADVPWGAAVRKDELNEPIGQELSAAIIDWHKSGMIAELETKWGIPQTSWVLSMKEKCMAGEKICDAVHDEGE